MSNNIQSKRHDAIWKERDAQKYKLGPPVEILTRNPQLIKQRWEEKAAMQKEQERSEFESMKRSIMLNIQSNDLAQTTKVGTNNSSKRSHYIKQSFVNQSIDSSDVSRVKKMDFKQQFVDLPRDNTMQLNNTGTVFDVQQTSMTGTGDLADANLLAASRTPMPAAYQSGSILQGYDTGRIQKNIFKLADIDKVLNKKIKTFSKSLMPSKASDLSNTYQQYPECVEPEPQSPWKLQNIFTSPANRSRMIPTTISATTGSIMGDDSGLASHTTPTVRRKKNSLVYNNTMSISAGMGALDSQGEGHFPHGSRTAAKAI